MKAIAACLGAALAAVLWGAGCGDVVVQPIGAAGGAGVVPGDDAGDAGLGADATPQGDASPAFCSGHGPIPLPGTSACLGDLADVFRFAACACTSLQVSGKLTTDSFDSDPDGGTGGAGVASIASNGEIATNATTNVSGSLWAGAPSTPGAPAVTLRSTGSIARDVRSGAGVEVGDGGAYLVEGNVWADGNVVLDPGASLAVGGTVHVPPGDSASGVQGNVVTGPVAVGAPCNCSHPIDVAAVVAAFAADNDDAAVGLAPVTTLAGTVTLPCGRYYVAGIAGGAVTLQVNGRVALMVAGDVAVTQDLHVALAPGAELDLFVKGGFDVMGSLEIGDTQAPARTRLYVGGTTFSLSATAKPLAANVYAPNATLLLSSDFEMWGALFAQAIQLSGAFTIHYDTSVLQVAQGSGCAPGGGACTTCDDCGGATPSCKNGACAPCSTDADCCAPLACDTMTGRCVLTLQ